MRRPTKAQAEAWMVGAIMAAAVGYQIVTQGVVGTIYWLLGTALVITVLMGLLLLARRIGR